jgi:hypothetical protein
MCSVRQKTRNFLAIANWMTSSRESFAWPGQNWPEWLWCEKGIIAAALSLWGIYGTGAGAAVSRLIADKRVSMMAVQIQSEEKSGILLGSNQGQTDLQG